MPASSSRTTGSAWPQYGHSKSPYSTRVTGAFIGPRMWSRSGSTGTARSVTCSAVPRRARIFSRLGSRMVALNTSQVTADEHSAADRMPSLASASRVPWKASAAMSSDTVKPIPAMVPAPSTAAQPTGGWIRPRVSLLTSQAAPVVPTGLPTT